MIDPERVAVAGHSIGGNAAASLLQADRRVDVGVNLDGTFFDPVRRLERPFLLLGTRAGHRPAGEDATWRRAWQQLDGPRAWFTVAGSAHFSFVDFPVLVDQAGLQDPGSSIRGRRAMAITRTLVTAFMDRHLRGREAAVLDRPGERLPEVRRHRPGLGDGG